MLRPEQFACPALIAELVAQAHVAACAVGLPELDLVRDQVVERPVLGNKAWIFFNSPACVIERTVELSPVGEHFALVTRE